MSEFYADNATKGYDYGGAHICYTPMKVMRREPDRVRWCFKCRKHLSHDWVVKATVEPSYYDPYGMYECSGCREEHVLFPGREWVWPDE